MECCCRTQDEGGVNAAQTRKSWAQACAVVHTVRLKDWLTSAPLFTCREYIAAGRPQDMVAFVEVGLMAIMFALLPEKKQSPVVPGVWMEKGPVTRNMAGGLHEADTALAGLLVALRLDTLSLVGVHTNSLSAFLAAPPAYAARPAQQHHCQHHCCRCCWPCAYAAT